MGRKISTSEALMTDPTTPEGAAYWQERHDYEAAIEDRIPCPRCGLLMIVDSLNKLHFCPSCARDVRDVGKGAE